MIEKSRFYVNYKEKYAYYKNKHNNRCNSCGGLIKEKSFRCRRCKPGGFITPTDVREKISIATKIAMQRPDVKKKITGIKHKITSETRKEIAERNKLLFSGEKNHNWKGGKIARLERNRIRVKKWKKENPEKYRITHSLSELHRRVRIKKNGFEKISYGDWLMIVEKYKNKCAMCGKTSEETKLTIDHIIPISRGGAHKKDNLQPLCLHCNTSKGNKVV